MWQFTRTQFCKNDKQIWEIRNHLYLFCFSVSWYDRMLIPSLVISSLISKVLPESDKDSLKQRYDHYKMDMLAYKYWQQQRDIHYWENIDGHEFEKVVYL